MIKNILNGLMSEEEEDFETPQFRIKNYESIKRSVQLRPHTPTFGRAPSSDSFLSMKITASLPQSYLDEKNPYEKQNHKSITSMLDMVSDNIPFSENSISTRESIDPNKVNNELKKLYPNATPFIEEIVNKSALGTNQLIIDLLDHTLFLPLSSILHAYKDRKALVIVPSVKFAQWIRGFLTESTIICPEGRLQQQKVLNQISSGRTQVLLCISNRLSTLPLALFDIIYVLKAELFIDSLAPLYNFRGLLIIHQTPGYMINDDFDFSILNCSISKNPELKPKCIPTSVFEVDYLDSLYDSIDNTHETTVIVVPFKTTTDKIFKRIHGKSIKYENYTGDEKKAVVTTIAFLYNIYNFEHYIFIDFPPSISHFLMSTYAASKVTVFVHIPTAIKLQSLSHNCGIDLPILQQIVQDIFWSGSSYRKVDEYCSISTSGIDITDAALNTLIRELTKLKLLNYIPFDHQLINIKIISAIHQKSNLLSAISQNKSNAHGYYNIPIINLCRQLGMSPYHLEDELERMASNKIVQYKYNEKSHFFRILKEFKDDDEFMDMLNQLFVKFNQFEEKKDHQYDLLFTVLKKLNVNHDENHDFDLILNNKEPDELVPIPHASVSIFDIKKLLSSSKRGEWTPRVVARIFHGISSPIYTSTEFARSPFWGKQSETSFKEIMKICQSVACNPSKLKVDEEE